MFLEVVAGVIGSRSLVLADGCICLEGVFDRLADALVAWYTIWCRWKIYFMKAASEKS